MRLLPGLEVMTFMVLPRHSRISVVAGMGQRNHSTPMQQRWSELSSDGIAVAEAAFVQPAARQRIVAPGSAPQLMRFVIDTSVPCDKVAVKQRDQPHFLPI